MTAPQPTAVLLIALSARPYVQALKDAGFYTVVIDGFLDQETRFFSDEVYQVDFDGLGFVADQFEERLAQLVSNRSWLGCIYGAGVEAQPALLNLVSVSMPLLGNTPKACEAVNAPNIFFPRCAGLSISTPEWQFEPPKQQQHDDPWLKKTVGGAGGNHIQLAKSSDEASAQVYYQHELKGESISVLFMAFPEALSVEKNAIILGIHTQWTEGCDESPYRLGGLAALDVINTDVKSKLQEIIQKLTSTFGLAGLNSLDVIVQQSKVFVLELNPRLSLSLDLYLQDYNRGAQVNLLALHLLIGLFVNQQDSALKQQILHAVAKVMAYHKQLRSGRLFKAIAIVYAPVSFELKENVLWPEWVVDRPAQAGGIAQNSPVCSVFASANTTALAKEQVLKRAAAIKQNAID